MISLFKQNTPTGRLISLYVATFGGSVEQNLLDYNDLVNKNYGGSDNTHNVRPWNRIPVTPGSKLVMTCDLAVTEFDVRFYDENGTYDSSDTYAEYNDLTVSCEFTVPDYCVSILPKWYRTGTELLVDELIAANPVIKYVRE